MKLQFREATEQELPILLALLVDDGIGKSRDDASSPPKPEYVQAMQHILQDPNNELVVALLDEEVVGMLQLTFIPYLSRRGAWRGLIECVRVRADRRGQQIGTALFEWAIERAKTRGCAMVQLTSDKRRTDALRFYRRLGFVDSHEGFKLSLV